MNGSKKIHKDEECKQEVIRRFEEIESMIRSDINEYYREICQVNNFFYDFKKRRIAKKIYDLEVCLSEVIRKKRELNEDIL